MKKILLISTVMVFLIACGGVKKTQEAVNTGNYAQAINNALRSLSENKSKKNHQPYVILLEDAFAKYSEREQERIAFLKQDGNPANYEAIYNGFLNLKNMQQRIQPILPLWIYEEDRNAQFSFVNYDGDILAAKDKLSEYLYDNANQLLTNATNKYDYRNAYDDFKYLSKINPGYADCKEKMEDAYYKGLDYVKVEVVNDTRQIVPDRLEEELLNFNTFGLNDQWTEYHTNPVQDLKYNYEMQVAFRDISISPEHISEKQIIKEKQIKDGYEYLEDADGNIVRDSLGNKIKVDRLRTVTCNFYEFTQHKAAQVSGNVSYIDLETKQQMNTYPLTSEFIFQHVYADYDGDKRALDTNQVPLLKYGAVPFPSNEQMVYDAGEDLKLRLKDIVVRHKFN